MEAEKLFAGEPETALIAAILWAFEVRARQLLVLSFPNIVLGKSAAQLQYSHLR